MSRRFPAAILTAVAFVAAGLPNSARAVTQRQRDLCFADLLTDATLTSCSAIIGAASATPGEKAKAYYFRGKLHSMNLDDDDAIADFSKAIALKPDFPEAFEERGIEYWARGENDKALSDFSSTIAIKPDCPDCYHERGKTYAARAQAGDVPLAIADYDKAIELDSTKDVYYLDRADAYEGQKNFGEAIADYGRMADVSVDSRGLAFRLRGLAYLKKGDADNAISDFDRSQEIGPDSSNIFGRAQAHFAKHDFERSIADYSEVITGEKNKKNKNEWTYVGRGAAYWNIGEYRQALSDFDSALAINDSNLFAIYGDGLAKRKVGDAIGGDAMLRKAAAAHANVPAILDGLGLIGVESDHGAQPESVSTAPGTGAESNGAVVAPQPTPVGDTATATEIAFWNTIKNSTDTADFDAYLSQFPDGAFVVLAHNRLRALGAIAPASK